MSDGHWSGPNSGCFHCKPLKAVHHIGMETLTNTQLDLAIRDFEREDARTRLAEHDKSWRRHVVKRHRGTFRYTEPMTPLLVSSATAAIALLMFAVSAFGHGRTTLGIVTGTSFLVITLGWVWLHISVWSWFVKREALRGGAGR